ncbi:hypothetical protein EDEG_01035 [Edhazardia aedis USNM 41457]|uniref:Translocation protein SEC62 n=1 Tax=Edhazardia aedis (strain USNM 41457) TaxID=1003232 RepID=J9DQB5_EDHAE|nr:hypothetical protein EDEG_01035 [Edhazardia aedis USNM 41457]|eukprot:EJW04745.1 hypothetical protein EDEG_01035 [Edhazardia aedis USNM 41457]
MNTKNLEKNLRKLPTEERILNGKKRVQIIKGITIYNSCKQQQMSDDVIKENVGNLLSNGILVKAILNKDNKNCDFCLQGTFKKEDSYIWISEGSQLLNLIISICVIIGCLLIAMFQMWPSKIRGYSVYVAYLMMGFIGFMLFLGVLRLVIFSITFFSNPPGIWLFPNLFADVGFFESFVPVWEYHGVKTKSEKEE